MMPGNFYTFKVNCRYYTVLLVKKDSKQRVSSLLAIDWIVRTNR